MFLWGEPSSACVCLSTPLLLVLCSVLGCESYKTVKHILPFLLRSRCQMCHVEHQMLGWGEAAAQTSVPNPTETSSCVSGSTGLLCLLTLVQWQSSFGSEFCPQCALSRRGNENLYLLIYCYCYLLHYQRLYIQYSVCLFLMSCFENKIKCCQPARGLQGKEEF